MPIIRPTMSIHETDAGEDGIFVPYDGDDYEVIIDADIEVSSASGNGIAASPLTRPDLHVDGTVSGNIGIVQSEGTINTIGASGSVVGRSAGVQVGIYSYGPNPCVAFNNAGHIEGAVGLVGSIAGLVNSGTIAGKANGYTYTFGNQLISNVGVYSPGGEGSPWCRPACFEHRNHLG